MWSIGIALNSQQASTAPTHYFPLHMSPLRSISVMRFPPVDGQQRALLDAEPTLITTAGYDGSHMAVDLRDVGTALTVVHERSMHNLLSTK